MNFQTAVKTAFSKYIVISGRARRAEYWFFAAFCLLGGIITGFVDGALFGGAQITNAILVLAIIIPSITLQVRRLHDMDRSGWWALLILAPVVGSIVLMIWSAFKGTEGSNRFGADPLQ